MRPKRDLFRINFLLPTKLVEQMRQYCADNDKTMTDFVRGLIEDFFRKVRKDGEL